MLHLRLPFTQRKVGLDNSLHGDSLYDYRKVFELAEPVFPLKGMVKVGDSTIEFTGDIDVLVEYRVDRAVYTKSTQLMGWLKWAHIYYP